MFSQFFQFSSLMQETGVRGLQVHPKSFDLVKIRAKSEEICAKYV